MTNAVLSRVKAQRAAQKRRRGKILAAAACACCIALAVFAAAKTNLPLSGEKSGASRLSVFCVMANATEQRQQMLEGEKVPYHALIRVRDVSGVDDTELLELRRADKEYAQQIAGQNPDELSGGPDWSTTGRITDKVMITTIFAGNFFLSVDDYEQVRDVSVTTTEIGFATRHGVDYYAESEKDGIGITWALSEAGVDMIEKNPDMKLSELNDTVTVTVEFLDGSKETAVIAITVDDDGQIYGTFEGSNVVE